MYGAEGLGKSEGLRAGAAGRQGCAVDCYFGRVSGLRLDADDVGCLLLRRWVRSVCVCVWVSSWICRRECPRCARC